MNTEDSIFDLTPGPHWTYFGKEHSDSTNKYCEDDVIKIVKFLVDNMFVVFAGRVFQQTVGIPMGTDCADIFLYSYDTVFALNGKETDNSNS